MNEPLQKCNSNILTICRNKTLARISITALLICSSNIHANIDENMFASCASKENSNNRLSCYDDLAKLHGVFPQLSLSNQWRTTKKINPLDDTKTILLSLRSSNKGGRPGSFVTLQIRCMSGQTEAFINWNDYLGSKANVTTRVGKLPMTTSRWSISTDSKSTFAPRPIEFIRSLVTANSLVSQVTPYNENPVTVIFDTTGLDKALEPILQTCNWSLDEEEVQLSNEQKNMLLETLLKVKEKYGEDSPEYKSILKTINN